MKVEMKMKKIEKVDRDKRHEKVICKKKNNKKREKAKCKNNKAKR